METKIVSVTMRERYTIPAYYTTNSCGKKTIAFRAGTEQAKCFGQIHRLRLTEPLLPDEIDDLISHAYESLGDREGLIEVGSNKKGGLWYHYIVTKKLKFENDEPASTLYRLTMDLWPAIVTTTRVEACFEEVGRARQRDNSVREILESEGRLGEVTGDWASDPYDPCREGEVLLLHSELAEFDEVFPDHPLTLLREFVRCITGGGAAVPPGYRPSGHEKPAESIDGQKDASEALDEYDLAVISYNAAYTDLNDCGIELLNVRTRSIDLIWFVQSLVNSIANRPKSFDANMGEVDLLKRDFVDAELFAKRELDAARKSAMSASAGATAGMAVASMAPSAAMWIATTFGTASTGTAISTLSGAAATKAALAWLGGGALAAGGGGIAAGNALLALAGPVGWGIAGATLLTSIVLFKKSKRRVFEDKQKELIALKENTEQVKEMHASVNALLEKTSDLRDELADAYTGNIGMYGADFSKLSRGEQAGLTALVNCTLSLAKLLGERLSQEGE